MKLVMANVHLRIDMDFEVLEKNLLLYLWNDLEDNIYKEKIS